MQLQRVMGEIPPSAEVIASQGVIGRFAGRRYVYPVLSANQVFPIRATTVIFVLAPDEGIELAPPASTGAAAVMVRDRLHARVLTESAGIQSSSGDRHRA